MPGFYRAETFKARDCVGYLVARAHTLMRTRIEAAFEKGDLTFTHWRVLMCLRDNIAVTCADISREIAHDSGSLTRIVDQLERRGLLRRTRDKKDRRIVTLALTQQGRAAVNALVPKVVEHSNLGLEGFTAQETKTLIALLTRLIARVRDIEEGEKAAEAREYAA
jgi:DNA-binding MarR family transcriptional regulator